jgi:hypothetical protein
MSPNRSVMFIFLILTTPDDGQARETNVIYRRQNLTELYYFFFHVIEKKN